LDADKGETKIDCGGECGPNCNVCSPTNGAIGHCRDYCQCSSGQGNCYQDDECAAPLICGVGEGPHFGFSASINVCVAAHCINRVKDTGQGESGVDCGGECGTCP
jgi:hypothetical protein